MDTTGNFGQSDFNEQLLTTPPDNPATVYPVLDQQYCGTLEKHYVLKEKLASWSGDDICVSDADGNTLYRVDAKALSLGHRRELIEEKDKVVASLTRKAFGCKSNWSIFKGPSFDKEVEVATLVAKKFTWKPQVKVYTQGQKDISEPAYLISGTCRARSFRVVHCASQRLAAEVSRTSAFKSAAKFFLNKDTYTLRVMPGFDHAFMLAIVAALDQWYTSCRTHAHC